MLTSPVQHVSRLPPTPLHLWTSPRTLRKRLRSPMRCVGEAESSTALIGDSEKHCTSPATVSTNVAGGSSSSPVVAPLSEAAWSLPITSVAAGPGPSATMGRARSGWSPPAPPMEAVTMEPASAGLGFISEQQLLRTVLRCSRYRRGTNASTAPSEQDISRACELSASTAALTGQATSGGEAPQTPAPFAAVRGTSHSAQMATGAEVEPPTADWRSPASAAGGVERLNHGSPSESVHAATRRVSRTESQSPRTISRRAGSTSMSPRLDAGGVYPSVARGGCRTPGGSPPTPDAGRRERQGSASCTCELSAT